MLIFDYDKIEAVYPGAGHLMWKPQLIHKSTDEQLKAASESGEWFAQIKKDGALYMLVKGSGGQMYLFGRTVSKKTGLLTEKSANVPHIMKAFDFLPNSTVLLGEIYYPNKTSKDVVSIMGCLPQKAISRQEGEYGKIHYYVYDMLAFDGKDMKEVRADFRYYVLSTLMKNVNIPEIELAKCYTQNLYQTVGEMLAKGEEGMVFKRNDAIYQPDARPMTYLKAKQVDYIDAVVMGFVEPTVQYTGKDIGTWEYWAREKDDGSLERIDIGLHYGKSNDIVPVTKYWYNHWRIGIVIGLFDDDHCMCKIGTISSGLTDETRKDLSEHPENYLNRVARIQCMSKDNQEHTLRHGFLVDFRDDKNIEDCTMESVFEK